MESSRSPRDSSPPGTPTRRGFPPGTPTRRGFPPWAGPESRSQAFSAPEKVPLDTGALSPPSFVATKGAAETLKRPHVDGSDSHERAVVAEKKRKLDKQDSWGNRLQRKQVLQRLAREHKDALREGISPESAFQLLSANDRQIFGCVADFSRSVGLSSCFAVGGSSERPHERLLKPEADVGETERDAVLTKKVALASLAVDRAKELQDGLDARSAFDGLPSRDRAAFGSMTNFLKSLSSCEVIHLDRPKNAKKPPPPEKRILRLVAGLPV